MGNKISPKGKFIQAESFLLFRPLKPNLIDADLDEAVTLDFIALPIRLVVNHGDAAAGLIKDALKLHFFNRRIGLGVHFLRFDRLDPYQEEGIPRR